MKKIFSIAIILVSSTLAYSQVIIGSGKTQITNTSVSLEFGTEEKGIVLPWVTSAGAVTGAVDGTLVFDSTDKKVKLMKAGSWFDLSVVANGTVDTSLQNALVEGSNAKASIGNPVTPSVPGILVLEDNNKGMILPQVASYANITSPTTGMMVFDTSKKLLCFFNGAQWTFWQPTP